VRDHRTCPAACRNCGRTAPRLSPPPNGWYNLSVNIPPAFDPRGYIWLGVFCSLGCLERHLPVLRHHDLLTQGAYQRE
jgi:hypothetical protein